MARQMGNTVRDMGAAMIGVVLMAVLWIALSAGCAGPIDNQACSEFIGSVEQAQAPGAAPTVSITVFPTIVRSSEVSHDVDAGKAAADYFTSNGLAAVTWDEAGLIPAGGTWGHNQAKMFRQSIESFAQYLADAPIKTDYAFVSEYLISSNGRPVGVHGYLLKSDGTPAYGLLLNSHHEPFYETDPQTIEDATTVLCNGMALDMMPEAADGG
ncbi:MAG: hypothetical protein HND57_08145 [Planctomycetes bacterium]|nr:hypothetical protein [Planctomycetota bacterium]